MVKLTLVFLQQCLKKRALSSCDSHTSSENHILMAKSKVIGASKDLGFYWQGVRSILFLTIQGAGLLPQLREEKEGEEGNGGGGRERERRERKK